VLLRCASPNSQAIRLGRARIIHETPWFINYNARLYFYQPSFLPDMRTEDFDFELPERLIAQHPPKVRGASRLLLVGHAGLVDKTFLDLPGLLNGHDVLILNDTRVLKARLLGKKASGGQIEVMVERVLSAHEVLAKVRASKSPKAGSHFELAETIMVEVLGREDEFFHLRFACEEPVEAVLEQYGKLPLPPYITHAADAEDDERYQTIFAREQGAVAAPTAGLHFDQTMLDTLCAKGVNIAYVTLHVGAGTFQPVRVDNVEDHVMHSERYTVPQATVDAIQQAKAKGGRVVAVGTTSLRALESAAAGGELKAGSGETRIFITPGYRFKVIDVLLTNFHLPRSTLLMLVCAFGGMQKLLAAYEQAVHNEYRFFSYGDAMLIEREL
jgi:S-adenosylmethionine:tRNA ribosyltransferase-isomerase